MEPKEEIRNRLDVAEVVGEYLNLKNAGGASMKACCPFHSEKTPSFYVSKEKQIWHCFGCGKGGDIFSFVMDIEGVDFPEALRTLAKKAGVEVPRFDSTKSNERARVVEINELARRFFEKVFTDSECASHAREYVKSRGISNELREEFALGYAPDKWDSLVSFLARREFGGKEILAAGLALNSKSGHGLIDRFRNRLMIPLCDQHGNTIAFTGRVFPTANSQSQTPASPKYMNSPETSAYRKGEMLYGLSKAKQAIKIERSVVIVEGNLDVIASHKAGVKNVVASSGTALTEAQVNLLKRYTNTLVFCFDQDAAGFNAAQRGIHLATELGCDVKVLLIPQNAGKDPDEVVQKNSELWKQIVLSPTPIMEYYFAHATRGKDFSQVSVKKEVGNFLLAEISRLKDDIEREHWLSKLADILKINIDVLRGTLNKTKNSSDVRVAAKSQTKQSEPAPPSDRLSKTFEVVIAMFVQFENLRKLIEKEMAGLCVEDNPLSRLYDLTIFEYHARETDANKNKSLFSELENKLASDVEMTNTLRRVAVLGERLSGELSDKTSQSYLQEHLNVLRAELNKNRRQILQQELRAAEARGDKEAVRRLLKEFQDIK